MKKATFCLTNQNMHRHHRFRKWSRGAEQMQWKWTVSRFICFISCLLAASWAYWCNIVCVHIKITLICIWIIISKLIERNSGVCTMNFLNLMSLQSSVCRGSNQQINLMLKLKPQSQFWYFCICHFCCCTNSLFCVIFLLNQFWFNK